MNVFNGLVDGVVSKFVSVRIVKRVGPRHAYANQLNEVSESIEALGWVSMDEKATFFVGDSGASSVVMMHTEDDCFRPEHISILGRKFGLNFALSNSYVPIVSTFPLYPFGCR